jgi:hypothetical protein
MHPVPAGRRLFPPQDRIVAKAIACESRLEPEPAAGTAAAAGHAARTASLGRAPLARLSVSDVCERLRTQGIGMSYSTVWRTLARDAIRPWLHEQWLFPRDPLLLEKATPVLDLYHGRWEGKPLGPRDYILCADEMTGLQAVSRIHPGLPPAPGRRARYEFEYERHGTLCYLAFLDVRSGRVWGDTNDKTGIEPFEGALGRCLAQDHYGDAERVFLVVDNGSSHHPSTSPARIQARYPQVTTVHLPVHSSWLNQIEIYFSIVARKVLRPADFPSLAALEQRLKWFQWYYNRYAQPFRWNYTRSDLEKYLERLALHEEQFAAAIAGRASTLTVANPVIN